MILPGFTIPTLEAAARIDRIIKQSSTPALKIGARRAEGDADQVHDREAEV